MLFIKRALVLVARVWPQQVTSFVQFVNRFQLMPYEDWKIQHSKQIRSYSTAIYIPSLISESKMKKYNRHQIPPSWDIATGHMRATKPGREVPIESHGQRFRLCPCCCSYVDKMPMSYFEVDKELFFLGEGFPLFYNTVKFSIIMLVLLLLDSSILSAFINMGEDYCEGEPHCQSSIVNQLSFVHKHTAAITQRMVLRICGFTGQLLLLLYFRDVQNVMSNILDQRNCTISDYSIQIQGIPQGYSDNMGKLNSIFRKSNVTTKQDICNEKVDVEIYQDIREVLLFQDLSEFYELQSDLEKLIKEKLKCLKKGDKSLLTLVNSDISYLEQRIQELSAKIKGDERTYFTGQAIVVFNRQEERDAAIQYLAEENEERDCTIRENYPEYDPEVMPIKVKQANEPLQIIWQNCHISYRKRIITIIVGWLFTILILSVTTVGCFYLISYKSHLVQQHNQQDNNIKIAVTISLLVTSFINIFNKFVLAPILHFITDKCEKHYEFSSLEFSFALKYAFSMFFTTALLTLIVEAMVFHNFTGTMGLISQETFMFIFNAYFSPVVMIINPYYMIYWVKRKLYFKSQNMTQEQANKLMEYPPYNVGKRYAEIIKTVWFTFLYAELIPMGAAFSATGIVLYYLVDKYTLLRKSSITGNISSNLSQDLLPALELVLVLKPLGELIFNYQIRDQVSTQSIVMILVGILFIILPKDKLLNACCVDKYYQQTREYDDVKCQLKSDYRTYYPLNRYQHQLKVYKGKDMFVFAEQESPQEPQPTADLIKASQDQSPSVQSLHLK